VTPAATPDGRYIVVDGRLWRSSNPGLSDEARQALVDELMVSRRAVKAALEADDPDALRSARSRVQAAKEALGERGAVWWDDGAPDFNRRLVGNSPYAEWWAGQQGEQG
jgi:hypothetical protein